MAYVGQTLENPVSGERITFRKCAADTDALVHVEVRPALQMEQLFETSVSLAEQGRTMLGGIPKPLELALFVREFEQEEQAVFPPRWMQRGALAPLAWLARRRDRPRTASEAAIAAPVAVEG